jgi:hypothetical protein
MNLAMIIAIEVGHISTKTIERSINCVNSMDDTIINANILEYDL